MKPSLNQEYAVEIYDQLLKGFSDEEDKRWDLNKINATEWFTGLVKAGALIFNKFTDNDDNAIEWTHTQQKLIIQDMMENGDSNS